MDDGDEGKGGERRPSRLLANDRYRPSAISASLAAGRASDFFKPGLFCICMRLSRDRSRFRVRLLFRSIGRPAATGRS